MSHMKRLVFGRGLMNSSLEGDKTFTIRKYQEFYHDFHKDQIIKGEFKDGLTVLLRITEIPILGRFKSLKSPKSDLKHRGYYFNNQYFKDLKTWYPDLTWSDTGIVICFEILKVDGVPVVSINEHMERD